jgi:hypothetical protein
VAFASQGKAKPAGSECEVAGKCLLGQFVIWIEAGWFIGKVEWLAGRIEARIGIGEAAKQNSDVGTGYEPGSWGIASLRAVCVSDCSGENLFPAIRPLRTIALGGFTGWGAIYIARLCGLSAV